jgi:hypothetical protein
MMETRYNWSTGKPVATVVEVPDAPVIDKAMLETLAKAGVTELTVKAGVVLTDVPDGITIKNAKSVIE